MRCHGSHQQIGQCEGKGSHIVLNFGDLRSLESVRNKGISDLDRLRLFDETLQEFVIDSLLNKDASPCTTALSVVEAIGATTTLHPANVGRPRNLQKAK